MRILRFPIVASLCLASACGGPQRATSMETAELRRQLAALRRQAEHDTRQIHDLENRALVCEDKLDTAQVAAARSDATPRLPVQHVRRDAEPSDDEPIRTGDPEPAWDDNVEIVYEGDAAKDDGPRKVIRIHETSDPVVTDEETPRAPVIRQPETPLEDPMTLYKSAYAALTRHDHVTAVAGFKTFLEKWPDHEYADNSQYWLGEAWYDMGDFKTALAEFRKVVKRYPLGNKAPDALLKVGYCYAKLNDLAAARDVLAQVKEIHPTSDAARLAQKKLEELQP